MWFYHLWTTKLAQNVILSFMDNKIAKIVVLLFTDNEIACGGVWFVGRRNE